MTDGDECAFGREVRGFPSLYVTQFQAGEANGSPLAHELVDHRVPDDRDLGVGEQIGRATSALQSLMRTSYAVFCLKKKTTTYSKIRRTSNTKQITKTNE